MEATTQEEFEQMVALVERSNLAARQFKQERDEAYADIGIGIKFFIELSRLLELEKNRDKEGNIKTGAIVMKLGMLAMNPEKTLAGFAPYLPHAKRLMEKYKHLIVDTKEITPHNEVT